MEEGRGEEQEEREREKRKVEKEDEGRGDRVREKRCVRYVLTTSLMFCNVVASQNQT